MNRFSIDVRSIVLPCVLLVLMAGAAFADRPYTESFDQTYPLAATGRVALDNVNGDVVIRVWDRDEVRIEALKSAESQELLETLKIEVALTANSIDIDTKYEKTGWGRGASGHRSVEYTVTVPRLSSLDAIDLVNGDLEVEALEGTIQAESVNGSLTIAQALSDLDLSTVNGSIEAACDRVYGDRRLKIESVNGRIDLHLAGSVDADISAKTVNGRIRNDFGIDVERGKYVGSSMNGQLGSGDARIVLSTVNGGIQVHSN